MPDRFDQRSPQYSGLDAELYDADYADYNTGDVGFYVEEAVACGQTVLELACGTGRITIPIATAGVEVVGVEISDDMLGIFRRKLGTLEPEIASRITLVKGDMRNFKIDRKFDLIIIPFRSFICLLTVEDEKETLLNVRNHLTPNGKLILNFYDPSFREILEYDGNPSDTQTFMNRFRHPISGNEVEEWSSWRYDLTSQTIDEHRNYIERNSEREIVNSTLVTLTVRYIHRWEMQHLLELCGYKVEALYGDFNRKPFRARGEQIWVATPAGTT